MKRPSQGFHPHLVVIGDEMFGETNDALIIDEDGKVYDLCILLSIFASGHNSETLENARLERGEDTELNTKFDLIEGEIKLFDPSFGGIK